MVYVSPLKALSNDIRRNLELPLGGIAPSCGAGPGGTRDSRTVRTGDTPQRERAAMRRLPPHILVTTPESLYLLLTSESGRRMLATTRIGHRRRNPRAWRRASAARTWRSRSSGSRP